MLLSGDAQLKNLKMIVLCAVYLQNFWEKVEKNIKSLRIGKCRWGLQGHSVSCFCFAIDFIC